MSNTPIRTTGDDAPDGVKAGNPTATIAQLHKIMDFVEPNGWKLPRVLTKEDIDLTYLPDQKFSESDFERKSNVSAVFFKPFSSEIALYTDIYARQNRAYFSGDRSQGKPSGYYLVAYKKTKQINQIPVEQVRNLKNPQKGEDILCFPGQEGYDTAEPDLRYHRDASPK